MNPPGEPDPFGFTWRRLREELSAVRAAGYRPIRCRDYSDYKASGSTERVAVVRVDIDFSLQKTRRLAELLGELGMLATFFVRLHAPEYNLFSFEDYRILRGLQHDGHELEHHSEIVDQAAIWGEDGADCLRRDIVIMRRMLAADVVGEASHGGNTGLNNLDFWRDRTAAEFGLAYEAYDRQPSFNLFHESTHISDSN
jgi:hypothetical protein